MVKGEGGLECRDTAASDKDPEGLGLHVVRHGHSEMDRARPASRKTPRGVTANYVIFRAVGPDGAALDRLQSVGNGSRRQHVMFSKVVVGIDGFRSDRDAVAAARAIAPSAHYDLVTVYADSGEPHEGGLDAYRQRLHGEALRRVEARRKDSNIPEAGVHAVPNYAPSRGLKRFARDTGADLIVLGAASVSPVERAVLGDVARGVLHGAPCPVLTVARSHSAAATHPQVIGVAYDSSPEANAALQLAVEIAHELGARLEIVEAVDIGVTPQAWGFQVAEYLEGLVGPEHDRIHALATSLSVPAKGSAVRGSVHQVMRELSTRVDLMVCGSRSWGTPGRVAFGSTADRLVHHSPCPVLVVPRGVEIADDVPAGAAAQVAAGHA